MSKGMSKIVDLRGLKAGESITIKNDGEGGDWRVVDGIIEKEKNETK